MDLPDDNALLRRYAEEKSEAAFAELVRRTVDRVYAGALRRVGGNAPLAEEVTQQVFTALAREAKSLVTHPVLSAWLFTTTRNQAGRAVRDERRRCAREKEIQLMHVTSEATTTVDEWTRLRPVLDEAMDELSERDREAVLLRFDEGKSFAEVGARLRLAENAARMRVDRALDKLHAALAKRGVTSTAAALGVALGNQAVAASAPAGLAASVTSAALAGGGLVVGASGWTVLMGMSVAKFGAGVALALVTVAGFWWRDPLSSLLRPGMERNSSRPVAHAGNPSKIEAVSGEKTVVMASIQNDGASESLGLRRQGLVQSDMADLEKEVVPVERCRNAGRATPVAALQTFIWAAMQGENRELCATLFLTDEAREKAVSWRSELTESAKVNFPQAESLPALFIAEEILRKGKGIQYLGLSESTSLHAIVRTRMSQPNGVSSVSKISMQNTPDGWKMIVPAEMIDGMKKWTVKKDQRAR